jgi:hypothetical protein
VTAPERLAVIVVTNAALLHSTLARHHLLARREQCSTPPLSARAVWLRILAIAVVASLLAALDKRVRERQLNR